MDSKVQAQVKTIKLTKDDIRHIVSEVSVTDRVDPFGEREYMLEYVDARVGEAMRGDPRLHRTEIRATSEVLLDLAALHRAYQLLTLETQTGLVSNSLDAIERIHIQIRAPLLREE